MGLGFSIFLLFISGQFAYEKPLIEKPVTSLVIVYSGVGFLFLLLLRLIPRTKYSKGLGLWVVGVGFLMRLIVIPSTAILEDDFYRYLWDGAVVAHGMNPYKYSPAGISHKPLPDSTDARQLQKLADEAGPTFERINHPTIRTIYPPITQAIFALSYVIDPWNFTVWKLLLFLVDGLNLLLFIYLLKLLQKSILYLALYWWNPLVVKEIFNSGHMDVLILPFLLFALIMLVKRKMYFSHLSLAFATGVKFWPIILLPGFLKPFWGDAKKIFISILLFVLVAGAMVFPLLTAGLDQDAALVNYSKRWEANTALFQVWLWVAEGILNALKIHPGHAQFWVRVWVVCLMGVWILAVLKFCNSSRPHDFTPMLYIVAALFLISPTQFPWYFIWVMPFLVFRPGFPLFLLVGLLPLYYLLYYFNTRGQPEIFHDAIVWIEYLPVWILLVLAGIKGMVARKKSSIGPIEQDFS
ncbi:MAG: hypothetical protein Kow0042_02240 [Calditrichia bacterium]